MFMLMIFVCILLVIVALSIFVWFRFKACSYSRTFDFDKDFSILKKHGLWDLFTSCYILQKSHVHITSKTFSPKCRTEETALLQSILSNNKNRTLIINTWCLFINQLISRLYKVFPHYCKNGIITLIVTGGSNFCLMIYFDSTYNYLTSQIKQCLVNLWGGWTDLDLKIKFDFSKIHDFPIMERMLSNTIFNFMVDFRYHFINCFPTQHVTDNGNRYKRIISNDYLNVVCKDNNLIYRYMTYSHKQYPTILSASYNIHIDRGYNNFSNFNLFRYKVPYLNISTKTIVFIENIDIGMPKPIDMESQIFENFKSFHFTCIDRINPHFKALSLYGLILSIENMLKFGCAKVKKRRYRLQLLKNIIRILLKNS